MNLTKLESEITRTRAKLEALQTRLKELEQQKTEAENLEIIGIVRELNLSRQELAAFLRESKARGLPPTAYDHPHRQEEFSDET